MRVLFCGSGSFALRPLQAIVGSEHEVVGLFTQPARPAGRGGKLRPTRVAEIAGKLGLDVTPCENINAEPVIADIRRIGPDVICVADFGQFIATAVRDAAPLGAFNLHGSLLPELRGAAPVNWAIIRGYRRTGVTTFSLVDRMDAGAIYAQAETDIAPDETAEELRERLSDIGAKLVCETLGLLAGGGAQGRQQDESKATPAPRLK